MIAVDNVSTGQQDGANSLTFSHTVNDNTQGIILVLVGAEANSANNGNDPVTSLTYNGNSLAKVDSQHTNVTPGGSGNSAEIWYGLAPATGAHNVVVTYTGNVDGDSVTAISLTGVDQTSPINTFLGGKGNSANPSTSVTTTVDNCLVLDILSGSGSGTTLTTDASQTERSNITNVGHMRSATSSEAKAAAGSVAMSWTMSSQVWAQVVVALTPYVASSATLKDVIGGTGVVPFAR